MQWRGLVEVLDKMYLTLVSLSSFGHGKKYWSRLSERAATWLGENNLQPRRASTRQRPLCEVRMGSLNVGTMGGRAWEVVEMMKRRKMEVLCVQDTKWKGYIARKISEGYTMLHAGRDGRSNGVGITVNVEISKEVLRVEIWQGRIIAVWMMIRQHMVCVICVNGPHTGRTEAEKEAVREEVERLVGLSDGQTMLCFAGDFNAHIGVVESGDE